MTESGPRSGNPFTRLLQRVHRPARQEAHDAEGRVLAPSRRSIVPSSTVTGNALIAVVAIMTFLAGITIGSVAAVRTVAADWTADIGRETTIQIKPGDGLDVRTALNRAVLVARSVAGVEDARVMDERETAALLEPWLGAGVDVANLPVPRLVVVKLASADRAGTLDALRAALASQVPSANLDDHRQWSERLSRTARTVVTIGLAVLVLVAAATVLSVVFATRAAVDAGRSIVEVLHFVGARDSFIAAEFQHHFLNVGLTGGLIGGGAAMALFFLSTTLPSWFGVSVPADTLVGAIALDARGYGGIAGVAVLVALVTAITSRVTVYRTLRRIG